jgi:cytochrome c oxidase assembly protein subunit 11
MPEKFIVDPKLPADVDTLTLAYTFYNNRPATKKLAEQFHPTPLPNS